MKDRFIFINRPRPAEPSGPFEFQTDMNSDRRSIGRDWDGLNAWSGCTSLSLGSSCASLSSRHIACMISRQRSEFCQRRTIRDDASWFKASSGKNLLRSCATKLGRLDPLPPVTDTSPPGPGIICAGGPSVPISCEGAVRKRRKRNPHASTWNG